MRHKVVGPPGTGKTKTLLDKVKLYLDTGISLDRIGYFAFTKKASEEARDRFLELRPNLTKKDIVLVTINYRLGPLGFFAHPELSKENKGSSGNQGYRDQVAALKWVQKNIKKLT